MSQFKRSFFFCMFFMTFWKAVVAARLEPYNSFEDLSPLSGIEASKMWSNGPDLRREIFEIGHYMTALERTKRSSPSRSETTTSDTCLYGVCNQKCCPEGKLFDKETLTCGDVSSYNITEWKDDLDYIRITDAVDLKDFVLRSKEDDEKMPCRFLFEDSVIKSTKDEWYVFNGTKYARNPNAQYFTRINFLCIDNVHCKYFMSIFCLIRHKATNLVKSYIFSISVSHERNCTLLRQFCLLLHEGVIGDTLKG